MRRFKLLLFPLTVTLLSGTCQKAVNNADSYVVPVNGSINFNMNSLERDIYFDSVVMDNRCPPNVTCIAAGEGVCRFIVRSGAQSQQVILSTFPGGNGAARYPREAQISGMNIRLETLIPFPRETYGAYKAQVVVTAL